MRPVEFREFHKSTSRRLRGLPPEPGERVEAVPESPGTGLEPFLIAAAFGLFFWALILTPFIL